MFYNWWISIFNNIVRCLPDTSKLQWFVLVPVFLVQTHHKEESSRLRQYEMNYMHDCYAWWKIDLYKQDFVQLKDFFYS